MFLKPLQARPSNFSVDLAKAEKLFDSVVISKVNKGYVDSHSSISQVSGTNTRTSESSSVFSMEKAAETYQKRLAQLTSGALDDSRAKRLIWRVGEVGYSAEKQGK